MYIPLPVNACSSYLLKPLLSLLFLLCITLQSQGQLNTLQTMYYQNKYIYNPAMAGVDKGLNLSFAYRKQWSGIPGTPQTGSLTADLQATEKVGLGVNVTQENAGLLKSTRVMGTYAYHVPLSGDNEHLNFGVSLGVNNSRADMAAITGDASDPEIMRYNQLKAYLDGDFGIAYTSSRLYVGAALPNLKTTISKSSDERFDADRLLFIGIASYKIPVGGDGEFKLEPLAGYRIVKGYDDIIDAGVNFSMERYGLFFQTLYHSSNSIGFGLGLDQKTYAFNFAYNIETGQLNKYNNGTFEIGIRLRLFNK